MSSWRSLTNEYSGSAPGAGSAAPGFGRWRPLVQFGIPLLLGAGLAVLLAVFIAQRAWPLALAVVFAVPLVVVLFRYPFAAFMIWMALIPYFLNAPTADQRAIYWVLHRAMIPGTLVMTVLSGWLGLRKRPFLQWSLAEVAMLAFLTLALGSTVLWNQEPIQSMIQLFDRVLVPYCAYWLIRMIRPGEQDLKRFLWVAFVTLLIQVAIGLLSWFAPEVLPEPWIGRTVGERTVGSLRNPGVYASTLIFLAILLYQYAMQAGSRSVRYLLVVAVGLAAFGVFFTFSRDSWLGGLLVLAGLLLLYPRPTLSLLVVLLLVGSVLGATLLAAELDWARERLTTERSAEGRLIVSNALVNMIRERPLEGWGYNNHTLYSPRFMESIMDIEVGGRIDLTSHNTYLTIAAELGLPALLLYLLPTAWWLIASLKVRRKLPSEGFWSWRLLAMLWLLMLHMFVVNNLIDMITHLPFGTTVWWIALGLIASMVSPYLQVDSVRREPLQPHAV